MATLPAGTSVPAAFGLLPNKAAKSYTHFLQVIKNLAEDMFTGAK
jgi:hypothetical protein